VTGLRGAGAGAHHSTTTAAKTANTPYAIAGSCRSDAVTRRTALTGPWLLTRWTPACTSRAMCYSARSSQTSAAHIHGYGLERRVTS
jgi:hypothetical protein